jgi:hypothetical protein
VGGFQSGGADAGTVGGSAAVSDARQPQQSAAAEESGAAVEGRAWQLVAAGALAQVHVEPVLYERPGDKRFFVRVRITNKTDRTIGVELGRGSVIDPNQWGIHPLDHRTIIDESRAIYPAPDDERKSQLLRAFRNGDLQDVRPKQSLAYFRAFEGKNAREETAAESGYFILSLDGRLLITDGRDIDDVRPPWMDGRPGSSELVIRCPVAWKRIGPMELIVDDR